MATSYIQVATHADRPCLPGIPKVQCPLSHLTAYPSDHVGPSETRTCLGRSTFEAAHHWTVSPSTTPITTTAVDTASRHQLLSSLGPTKQRPLPCLSPTAAPATSPLKLSHEILLGELPGGAVPLQHGVTVGASRIGALSTIRPSAIAPAVTVPRISLPVRTVRCTWHPYETNKAAIPSVAIARQLTYRQGPATPSKPGQRGSGSSVSFGQDTLPLGVSSSGTTTSLACLRSGDAVTDVPVPNAATVVTNDQSAAATRREPSPTPAVAIGGPRLQSTYSFNDTGGSRCLKCTTVVTPRAMSRPARDLSPPLTTASFRPIKPPADSPPSAASQPQSSVPLLPSGSPMFQSLPPQRLAALDVSRPLPAISLVHHPDSKDSGFVHTIPRSHSQLLRKQDTAGSDQLLGQQYQSYHNQRQHGLTAHTSLSPRLRQGRRDVSGSRWTSTWPYARRLVGLSNGGNTCFFNSILQGLLSCDEFCAYWLRSPTARRHVNPKSEFGGEMLQTWLQFLDEVFEYNGGRGSSSRKHSERRMGSYSSTTTDCSRAPSTTATSLAGRVTRHEHLLRLIRQRKPGFDEGQQADAHEILQVLLEALSTEGHLEEPPVGDVATADQGGGGETDDTEEHRVAAEASEIFLAQQRQTLNSEVETMWRSQFVSEIRCLRCSRVRYRFESEYDWDVELPAGPHGVPVALEELLRNSVEKENMVQLYCSKCKYSTESSVRRRPYRLAQQYLCVQIKRFGYSRRAGVSYRVGTPVQLPRSLSVDFRPLCSEDSPSAGRPAIFDLMGLTLQRGSLELGHYSGMYLVSSPLGEGSGSRWYYFSDGLVEPCSPENADPSGVYLLWFRRRVSNSGHGSRQSPGDIHREAVH